MDYALIWAALISIAVFAYVALDGFDLGIGLLFPWFTNEQHRDRMVNTVAPVWDGNETWLVLGGGGLLAVFPLAYSVLLPALYMPVIAMLLGLIFRGVAFEFRFKSRNNKHWWDRSFMLGSAVAAFSQGVMLGAMLQGIDVTDRAYSGGWFDWLSPFTIFAGIAVCIGYMLLGATWLIMKTDGQLQGRSFSLARNLSLLMILAIAAASIYLVSTYGQVADRWLTWPTSAGLWLLPFALAIVGGGLLTALNKKREGAPYLWALGVFLIAFIGFAVSIFPYLIPFEITLWEAAGPDNSLSFLLVGAVILIPIIFAYTGYTYWVFRGKTSEDSGYHE
ncbi:MULTISPECIES: cytochrome d ubiquinol oxidase subunit II [Idiomarina]|uniref:cytochrome d ubiquinol oxidase subunit II n=1 Tax=Idiomarina TaxID=135575 RepID=UPI00129CF22D|nr:MULTISPECIES: cytochrome d ubiquinol oxidase subunit II [Idiomarina]MRJ42830.1 cytochrome d ubiquinol oxidase subunit II [Idiomarina sp. FeN1]NCU58380.1 cytochrome d ubiquinol oxidase subunit II [Idiomarina sp. FenA--70]NCU61078.1 cytochrome d ubiquinol oxidase subunit II [Idiomarina sp. FenBw--71]UUN13068.1 cytochrome d ubiquinol oxidase subunit II [Idiomarina loihiensis]